MPIKAEVGPTVCISLSVTSWYECVQNRKTRDYRAVVSCLGDVCNAGACVPSGLQEGLRQHHTGYSRHWDLLQVLLREEVRPQGLRLRSGSRGAQHGQRRAPGDQTRRVSVDIASLSHTATKGHLVCYSGEMYTRALILSSLPSLPSTPALNCFHMPGTARNKIR